MHPSIACHQPPLLFYRPSTTTTTTTFPSTKNKIKNNNSKKRNTHTILQTENNEAALFSSPFLSKGGSSDECFAQFNKYIYIGNRARPVRLPPFLSSSLLLSPSLSSLYSLFIFLFPRPSGKRPKRPPYYIPLFVKVCICILCKKFLVSLSSSKSTD